MEQQNYIRNFFQSEVTWVISIIAFVWGVVVTVILPINTIQTQLAQIQIDIKTSKQNYTQVVSNNNDLSSRITILEVEVKQLQGK